MWTENDKRMWRIQPSEATLSRTEILERKACPYLQDIVFLLRVKQHIINRQWRWSPRWDASSTILPGADAQSLCLPEDGIEIDFAAQTVDELQEGIKVHLLPHYLVPVALQDGHTNI